MAYGLFEHMAHDDSNQRVERRKALALARVRANKRFGAFLSQAENAEYATGMDREARLTLVAGDLDNTVRQACAECGYSDWETVRDAIVSSLGFTVEAVRMPKMCPYHREVTDISLAAGEPQAGFGAMAQHAWGANHCQGEWDGKCNFKPQMTTQTFWDDKAQKAQERREQRELQQQEVAQEPVAQEMPEDLELPAPENAPEFEIEMPDHAFDGVSEMGSEQADLAPAMASRTAEALKTVDVTQGTASPEPNMDKRKWTPKNISWDQSPQMEGSPVPTREQDITQRAEYKASPFEDDGRLEQTRAVTETQYVGDGEEEKGYHGDTQWTGTDGQANPVTSRNWLIEGADDPDKNPFIKDDEDEENKEEKD